MIAVELKEPKGFGRIRMRHIPDASGDTLTRFVGDTVRLGSIVQTDGWRGVQSSAAKGLFAPTYYPVFNE